MKRQVGAGRDPSNGTRRCPAVELAGIVATRA
jgi:hypothetical protein